MTPEDLDISAGHYDHLLSGDDWWEIRKSSAPNFERISLVRWHLKRLQEKGEPVPAATREDAIEVAAIRRAFVGGET